MEFAIQENTLTERRVVKNLGHGSSLLLMILIIWYAAIFGLYLPVLHNSWADFHSFAASLESGSFLACVIPSFLLAPCYLVVATCFHSTVSSGKNNWSLLTLVLAMAYGALLSAHYYIQWATVDHNLTEMSTGGLSFWLFTHPNPQNIPGVLEGAGYAFMSLSFLSASMVFNGQNGWLQRMLFVSGLTGLAVFFAPIVSLPLLPILVIATSNVFFLLTAMLLWAGWFRRTASFS